MPADFSLLVAATTGEWSSLGGKPSVLTCVNGHLGVLVIRSREELIGGPLGSLRFSWLKPKIMTINGPHGSVDIFGTAFQNPQTLQLVTDLKLPPVAGHITKSEAPPGVFKLWTDHSKSFTNVTDLLPQLLADNGVAVAARS